MERVKTISSAERRQRVEIISCDNRIDSASLTVDAPNSNHQYLDCVTAALKLVKRAQCVCVINYHAQLHTAQQLYGAK